MSDNKPTERYQVVIRKNGAGWKARVENMRWLPGVQARDLSDVEPRVRRLIWSFTGDADVEAAMDVELQLPARVEVHLDLAEQLCDEAQAEVERAIADLLEAGVSVIDIGRILRQRGRNPPRALTISNREIVEFGLTNHPEAYGIRWDDHGRFLTITCRDCLESLRSHYLEFDLDAENILIYDDGLESLHSMYEDLDLDAETVLIYGTFPFCTYCRPADLSLVA